MAAGDKKVEMIHMKELLAPHGLYPRRMQSRGHEEEVSHIYGRNR